MIGLKGLQDDINIAHSVYATKLQSDVNPSSKQKNSQIMLIIIILITIHFKQSSFLCSFISQQIRYKENSAKDLSKYHLSMDMMEVAHAKKAQSLVSEQDYRLMLHQYTSLADDMKVQAAKRAYALQSEVRYGCRPLLSHPCTVECNTAYLTYQITS